MRKKGGGAEMAENMPPAPEYGEHRGVAIAFLSALLMHGHVLDGPVVLTEPLAGVVVLTARCRRCRGRIVVPVAGPLVAGWCSRHGGHVRAAMAGKGIDDDE